MKKYFSLIILTAVLLSACAKQEQPPAQATIQSAVTISQSVDSYFIEGTLENNAFTATQRVNYVNKEQESLNELYFHLYPNMYKDKNMIESTVLSKTYPNGFNEGGIEVTEVSLLGIKLDTEITDRLIKINLKEPLAPMESIIITFKYKTSLPNGMARMGYYNDCYNLTSFYPVAAVYEDGKWQTEKYSFVGDPFFTDMSDYYMSLTLPANFTVASTGDATEEPEDTAGMKRLKITAGNVREMAVVASPNLKVYQDNVGGIDVRSYYTDDQFGKLALSYAKDALSYYNATFGKYPYSQISVVGSEYYGGGMEYPNLVLITNTVYNEAEKADLEWVIAHEIAHQWWYGLVGSDPIEDPFLDESLTEYSTLSYAKSKYDEETYNNLKNTYILSPYTKYKHLLTNGKVHKNTTEYESSLELSMLVYIRGCMMYIDMENIMGEDALKQVLRSYYEKNAYTIVSADTWKTHLKESYEYDWDAFFDKWLYNTTP